MTCYFACCSELWDEEAQVRDLRVCPRGDLNPQVGEISLDLDLNSKTGEKPPDRGVHAAMLAGMPRLASNLSWLIIVD